MILFNAYDRREDKLKRGIYIISVCFMLMFVFSGCGKKNQMSEDIQFTLKEICSTQFTDEPYIYSYEITNSDIRGLIKNEAINELFLSQVQYKIESLSKESDNTHGEAIISFSFPDLMAVIEESAASLDSDSGTEALFSIVSKKLQGNCKKKKEKISVDMIYIHSHWYIIPNADFSNVLSGGMLEYYSLLGNEYVKNKTQEEP